MTSALTDLAGTALDVPVWTAGFIARHAPAIVALAAVPVVERATAVRWTRSRPTGMATFADLVTLTFRLLLLAAVVTLLSREEPELRTDVMHRLLDGIAGHWPLLLASIALFVVFFALLNLTGSGLGLLVDGTRSTRYALVVFTFRNAINIPLAVVWMCGVARQLLLVAQ